MPFVIQNAVRAAVLNQSGYVIDTDKLNAMPPGVFEMDGLRDKDSQSDSEVSRVYFVPWSIRHSFRLWALGYSTSVAAPGYDLATADAYWGSAVPTSPAPASATLSRVIPAQDPERAWLWASSCEMIGGKGAVVIDPANFVLDKNGNQILNPAGVNALTYPCVAYVDNSGGGARGAPPGAGGLPINGNANPLTTQFTDGAAVYKVTFRPRNYTVLNDAANAAAGLGELGRYVEITEEYNLEGLPLARLASSGQLQFVAGDAGPDQLVGVQIPEAGVKQIPTCLMNVDWHEVPDRPLPSFASCLGKINADVWPSVRGSPSYPVGTLFCLPWRTKQTTSQTGRVNWLIRYRFAVRPQGWNVFPFAHPTLGAGFRAATYGGGAPSATNQVFQSAPFASLFLVPPPVKYF